MRQVNSDSNRTALEADYISLADAGYVLSYREFSQLSKDERKSLKFISVLTSKSRRNFRFHTAKC